MKKRINKKTNRKIIGIVFIVITLLSISSISAFAVSTSWGLILDRVDTSYFHSFVDKSDWSEVRKRCYNNAYDLSSKFNGYLVNTNPEQNIVNQLNYIRANGDQVLAANYGLEWNNLYSEISNLIDDVDQICGGGSNIPVVNGKEVTTEVYQNMISNITDKYNELYQLTTKIYSSYTSAKFTASDTVEILGKNGYEIFTTLWNELGVLIKAIGTGSTSTSYLFGVSWTSDNIKDIANTVSPIVKAFAYGLAGVLFGINVSRSALQFELMEAKGLFKIFARVLLIKVWIDLSINICIYVLAIVNSLTAQVINTFTYSQTIFDAYNASSNQSVVDNDAFGGIGAIINLITSFSHSLPELILEGAVIFCILSVVIKLIARGFEITALVTISPLFFSTLIGEETRPYFKKFMAAFLSTCCYLLFVAAVYAVGTVWISDSLTSASTAQGVLSWFGKNFATALILIACCHIVRKPPKVLTELVSV